MIIFINGTFGVGKTTVAELLVKALPKSMLYDPEEIGTALRNILQPIENHDDFQHYPEWRKLTIETAKTIKEQHDLDLVIPMTIWRPVYFKEVTRALKEIDSKFHHFCLAASIATVHQRLDGRSGQKPGSWAHQQAEHAIPSLKSPLFARHLETENKEPEEIVKTILANI